MQTIRYWVNAALEANRRDHTIGTGDQTGPFRSARALGMTLVAMHDAQAAATGGQAPYHVVLPAPAGTQPELAMAAAAHRVLRRLYPGQAADLDAAWSYYAAKGATAGPSVPFGLAVGDAVMAWRAGDAAFIGSAYAPTHAEYDHDVDPLHPGQGFQGPDWGHAPPFLAALQPFAVPPGGNVAGDFTPTPYYLAEFQEVAAKGAETSATRTPDEEEIGIFWGYDGARRLGTPPRLYAQVAMTVLDGIAARPGSWMTPARYLEALTAMAVAMADAGIQAWHYKYSTPHMLWRPVLGIRNAPAGVAGAVADPQWRPLGAPATNQTNPAQLAATPNFPSYPSGHATFGGAAFEVLRRFIRRHDAASQFTDEEEDNIAFTFVSDEFDGVNTDLRTGKPRQRVARSYRSLWQAIVENSESRIWLGVHWRFDGLSRQIGGNAPETGSPRRPGELGPHGGVRLGMDIARVVAAERGFA